MADPTILSRLNWQDYKRNIVGQLVDFLSRNEDVYQRQLMRLMTDVARVQDFSHLARLDDGQTKVNQAQAAIVALQNQIYGLDAFLEDEREIERRRQEAYERRVKTDAVQEALQDLTREYFDLLGSKDPQGRGYRLEKILRCLFDVFDLDPRASFKITGEQIDGAFTFESTDYLLEAKWQNARLHDKEGGVKSAAWCVGHQVYRDLNYLRKLRNRVHIHAAQHDRDTDWYSFNNQEVKLMKKVLFSVLSSELFKPEKKHNRIIEYLKVKESAEQLADSMPF